MNLRIGSGYDVHRTDPTRPLILCGIPIESPFGLMGHSDADVAVHAIIDALLGAAALRDIGFHFPDTEDKYRGIDSMRLLDITLQMVRDKGFQVGNVDLTIIAQAPKLSPYIPAMIERLQGALGTQEVNVKATTHEHIGTLGRSEGIAAQAVVLLTMD